MGIPPEKARWSGRFSLGRNNTEEEVDRVIEAVAEVVKKIR